MISRSSLFAHYERAGRMSLMILLRLALALAVSAGLVAAAFAGERLVLKGDVTVAADILTLGDLVEGAPASAAATALFRAPGLGQTGTVQVRRILEAARPLGLAAIDAGGRTQIVVTRAARRIGAAEIEAAVKRALELQHRLDARALSVTFDGTPPALTIAPDAEGDVVAEEITYDRRSRRLSALVAVGGNAGKASVRVTGVALEYVEAAVLTRALNRGDTAQASDFVVERRVRESLPADAQLETRALAGQVARRALQAGTVVRAGDLARPEIVARGDVVTIVYEVPGMVLTLRGTASAAGAQGDMIAVVNPQTKKILQAQVVAPGKVSVSAPLPGRIAIEPHGQAMITPVSSRHVRPPPRATPSPACLCSPLSASVSAAARPPTASPGSASRRSCRRSRTRRRSRATSPCACRCPIRSPWPSRRTRCGGRARAPSSRTSAPQQIGDLVTVRVKVTDQAQINNSTSRSRKAEEGLGAQNLFGLEAEGIKFLPDGTQLDALVNADFELVQRPAPARSGAPSSSSPTSPRW